MASLPVQAKASSLYGSGTSIGDTTVKLASFADVFGNNLAMADFGTKGYGTIEPGTDQEEPITFSGVTANGDGSFTLTGVKSALAKSPFTEVSGLLRGHSGGTRCVISNTAAFYNDFLNKSTAATITQVWTFDTTTGRPKLSADTDTTVPTELVDYGQLSRLAIAGAPNASPTVKGLKEDATAAETASGTLTGATGTTLGITPDVLAAQIQSGSWLSAIDATGTDAYVITLVPALTAYTVGQHFIVKFGTSNTGAATLNVNGLGAKAIVKNGSTVLDDDDINAGMFGLVIYDGTNFQLNNITSVVRTQYFGDGSDGSATIATPTTLSANKQYTDLTVNDDLNANGYKVYVSGTLTIAAGKKIFNNGGVGGVGGNAASSSPGGIAGTAGAGAPGGTLPAGLAGSAGGAGGPYNGPGIAGVAGTSSSVTLSNTATATVGGASTFTGSYNGGAGGAGGAATQSVDYPKDVFQVLSRLALVQLTGATLTAMTPNASGGGGGGGGGLQGTYNNAGGGGGGSGGSGGVVFVAARRIVNTSGVYIQTKGGVGGAGGISTAVGGGGGGGGGAGGSGGVIILVYRTKTGAATTDVTGGAGGTASSTGVAGATGIVGKVYEFVV